MKSLFWKHLQRANFPELYCMLFVKYIKKSLWKLLDFKRHENKSQFSLSVSRLKPMVIMFCMKNELNLWHCHKMHSLNLPGVWKRRDEWETSHKRRKTTSQQTLGPRTVTQQFVILTGLTANVQLQATVTLHYYDHRTVIWPSVTLKLH